MYAILHCTTTLICIHQATSQLKPHPLSNTSMPRSSQKAPSHQIHPILTLLSTRCQDAKPQEYLRTGDQDAQYDQHDDNPGYARHLRVRNGVAEDLSEVKEDPAALVQDLDARFDLQILTHALIERVQGGFRVPEEVGGVKKVAG